MIVKHKLRGVGTKKNEVFGVFSRGGFSSKINFLGHIIEESKIRLNNNQNFIFVLMIFCNAIIKFTLKKILNS